MWWWFFRKQTWWRKRFRRTSGPGHSLTLCTITMGHQGLCLGPIHLAFYRRLIIRHSQGNHSCFELTYTLVFLHFTLNFALQSRFLIGNAISSLWEKAGSHHLTTSGHLLSVFGGPLTRGNFPLPLGNGSWFHRRSLEALHNLPPLFQGKGRLRTNNHHIGKLPEQKILDLIDCSVPMPYNFCVQHFWNTYVGGVAESVVILVFKGKITFWQDSNLLRFDPKASALRQGTYICVLPRSSPNMSFFLQVHRKRSGKV